MAGWCAYDGTAFALDRKSVDTDHLIPGRLTMTPRSAGYGPFLLHDLRDDDECRELLDFPLNRHPGASKLVTRRNFSSGSSREAAVYALVGFGVRVVGAPSFSDIFAADAINDGLLPAPDGRHRRAAERLFKRHNACVGKPRDASCYDRRSQSRVSNQPVWREKLITDRDDIEMTQACDPEIRTFRTERRRIAPWVFTNEQTTHEGGRR